MQVLVLEAQGISIDSKTCVFLQQAGRLALDRIEMAIPSLSVLFFFFIFFCPPRLTFLWRGCYGLCLRPETELAHSFYIFLCLFLSLWPFQLYFTPQILPTTLRFFTLFFQSNFCLIGPFNYIYIFMTVSFSPDIILSD